MALIADAGGGGGRAAQPWTQTWRTPEDLWGRVARPAPRVPPGAYQYYRPGRSPYTPSWGMAEDYSRIPDPATYWGTERTPAPAAARRVTPASPWGDVYGEMAQLKARQRGRVPLAGERIAAGERIPSPQASMPLWDLGRYPGWAQEAGLTINVGGQQPAQPMWQPTPGGGGGGGWGGGGGGGVAPAPTPAAPITPEAQPDWASLFQPTPGGEAPWDFLRLTPSDWRALPEEIRDELMEWLRGLGWRPGGVWGRYGPAEYQRAEPTGERGAMWGAEMFEGLGERTRAWIWWLASQKGWTGQEAARPETAGWSWA